MNVAVIGVGAIGGLLVAELLEAGHQVLLCTRTPLERLTVERAEHPRELIVPAGSVAQAPASAPAARTELAVVALKGQHSAHAMPWLERLAPETVIVIQNGVEHEAHIHHARLIPAITNTAVERVARGRLIHHAGDRITLADRPGATDFAALLRPTALTTHIEPDFQTAAWRKLLSNLAGNPITTLTGRRAEVFTDPAIRALTRAVLHEAVAVGRAEGAHLSDADVDATMAFYDALPPDTGSSMLYDRMAGRELEIEPLVGAVLRAAERHGIAAPRVHTLYALLGALG